VRRRDPLTFSCWGFLVGALFWSLLTPWWQIDPGVVGSSTSLLGALSERTVPVWALLAWMVLLGTLTPFVLETTALRFLPATVVGVVAMVEPIGAAALAWVWFGQALSAVQVLGGVVVLAGIVLAQLARGRGEPTGPLC
jgi:drug/metabolite transporter (DMT)-like permease